MMDIETTPVYFSEDLLGVELYPWQEAALTWFEDAPRVRVKGSLCTPNGAGKSERVVATLVLWWLFIHPQGKVVVTTKSGLQLDTQICPAIERHQGKFDGWKFIERRIETPTGGMGIFFVTDEIFRAEGHHPVGDPHEGPLLIIVDEAKSVPDEMMQALDRCNYAALLYVSSPGHKSGQFYESQFREELGFKRLRVSLRDCPHIPEERIQDIRTKYGADSAFAKSTLDGEFMDADTEARFNAEGLKRLREMADAQDRMERRDPLKAQTGYIEEGLGLESPFKWSRDDDGPYWIIEHPIPGCAYIGFCDPTTGKQAEGSKERDGCSGGILRLAYTDDRGVQHNDETVAFLHGHNGTDVHWDNDIVVEALDPLLRYYGDCPINVEANNSGGEIMTPLIELGRNVCRRKKRDHKKPGKVLEIVGYMTSTAGKSELVGANVRAIREQELDCRYTPAVNQLHTFTLDEQGRGCAQPHCHDDHCSGIALGLVARHWAKVYVPRSVVSQFPVAGLGYRGDEQRVGGAWS